MSPDRRRKRIACFHGGGSNGEIFEVQCKPLQILLEDQFEFVFFDGPFERSAGPGVLPLFVEYAPFKTWFTKDEDDGRAGKELSDGSGYEEGNRSQGRGGGGGGGGAAAARQRGGIARVLEMMEAEGDGGEWVAAMGFSQGTRVVGGLLLHQQRRAKAAAGVGSGDSPTPPQGIDFKFGVLCMGGGEPMRLESESDPSSQAATARDQGRRVDANTNGAKEAATTTAAEKDKITIPTLHLHGLKDPYLPNGVRQLAMNFDPAAATLCKIDYHHAMPWIKSDALQLANLITKMCRDTATVSRSGS